MLSVLFTKYSTCQTISIKTNDCINPFNIKENYLYNTISPKGPGEKIDISNQNYNYKFLFEKEHNTIWYKFTAPESGRISFTISPDNLNDDYDFAVFEIRDSAICELILKNTEKPIRSCISRNNTEIKSITGLNDSAIVTHIAMGPGDSFVKAIEAKSGQEFMLVVDNVYSNGYGHKIKFNYPKKKNAQELKKGKSLRFSSIMFHGNEATFLPESKQALDSLLDIMITNPTLKIEIQGHVNDPDNEMTHEWNQGLSEKRAKAVFNFLLSNNIHKDRLTWKGYSNTKMIYPKAKSEREYKHNRRVEILITDD